MVVIILLGSKLLESKVWRRGRIGLPRVRLCSHWQYPRRLQSIFNTITRSYTIYLSTQRACVRARHQITRTHTKCVCFPLPFAYPPCSWLSQYTRDLGHLGIRLTKSIRYKNRWRKLIPQRRVAISPSSLTPGTGFTDRKLCLYKTICEVMRRYHTYTHAFQLSADG